jgi:hypothetical protein
MCMVRIEAAHMCMVSREAALMCMVSIEAAVHTYTWWYVWRPHICAW